MGSSDIGLREILSVLGLSQPPEELNPHQIGSVFGIQADWNVVALTPGHDVLVEVNAGVVDVDRPFVASRQRLLC